MPGRAYMKDVFPCFRAHRFLPRACFTRSAQTGHRPGRTCSSAEDGESFHCLLYSPPDRIEKKTRSAYGRQERQLAELSALSISASEPSPPHPPRLLPHLAIAPRSHSLRGGPAATAQNTKLYSVYVPYIIRWPVRWPGVSTSSNLLEGGLPVGKRPAAGE
ncbi:hypothetical protein VUR80DRAFT_8714 [Thermomyces stellatus]